MGDPDLVLAIDPATRLIGYALLDVSRPGQPRYVDSGVLEGKGGTLDGRLASIHWHVRQLVAEHGPSVIAVETGVIYKQPDDPTKRSKSNPMTALHQAEARGAILAVAYFARIPVARYSPGEVKKAATGKGNAKKPLVQEFVKAIFLRPHVEPDEADALAVAVCHANRMHSAQVLSS